MTSAQLYLTASATSDAQGNVTITFQPPRVNRTWQGAILISNAPASSKWTITIGGRAFGYMFAPGPAGPFQIQSGESVVISSSNVAFNTSYTAVLSGVDEPTDKASVFTGPRSVTSVGFAA